MTGIEDLDLNEKAAVPFNLFVLGRSAALGRANEKTLLIYKKELRRACNKVIYYKDYDTPIENPISRDQEYETYGNFFLKNKKVFAYDFSKTGIIDHFIYVDWIDQLKEPRKTKVKDLLFARHGMICDLAGDFKITYPINSRSRTILFYDKNIDSIPNLEERLDEVYKQYPVCWVAFKEEVETEDLDVIEKFLNFKLRSRIFTLSLIRMPTEEEIAKCTWIKKEGVANRVKIKVTLDNPKTSSEKDYLVNYYFNLFQKCKLDFSPKIEYNLSRIEDKDLRQFFSVMFDWANEKTLETLYSFARRRLFLINRFELIAKSAGIENGVRGIKVYG